MSERKPTEPLPWRASLQLMSLAGVRPLTVLVGLGLLQALLPLCGLVAMKHLVDTVADGIAGRIAADRAMTQAMFATATAAFVSLAGGLVQSFVQLTAENHGRRLSDASVERLQRNVAHRALGDFDRADFHDGLQRAGAETGQRPVRLSQDLIAALVATVSLLAMASLLVQVEPWLPLLVGVAAAPIAWVRRRHAGLRFSWQRDHVVEQREVGYLGAALTARATAKDVRVLGLWRPFGARLEALRQHLRHSLARLARKRAGEEWLVQLLASAALFGAYALLARQALAGQMTLGSLVLQAQAAQRTQNAVRDLLGAWAGVREHRLFLRPLADFVATDARPGGAPQPADRGARGPIAFAAEALGFRYAGGAPFALHDVDFTVAAGERVAILGPNGSGKSTLVKLLAGLYVPQHGALTADGRPLAGWSDAERQRRLAVLFQDAGGFERTLRENLLLGNERPPDDEQLWRVLELVGLAERARELPAGLDTPWSRRLRAGSDWSGGEGRRVLLARTLLRDGDALLLDEPFAALDGSTARRVATHLREATAARTLIVVDHRGPVLDCVERAIWLDRGRVRAIATPDELRRLDGFAAQFPEWLQ